MYKKLVTISLFVFFAVVTATLTAGLAFYQNKQTEKTSSITSQPTEVKNESSTPYAMDEVAKHNRQSDCWQVIDGKVYDITDYFGKHPGGDGKLLKFCGKDGTTAFEGLPHSSFAWSLLPPMFVGDVK